MKRFLLLLTLVLTYSIPANAQVMIKKSQIVFTNPQIQGQILCADGTNAAPCYGFASQTNTGIEHATTNDVSIVSNGARVVAFSGADTYLLAASPTIRFGASSDTILAYDGSNTLAQRNGTNGQTFRVYNTFTDASNYERLDISWAANVLKIGTFAGGTGSTTRAMRIGTMAGTGELYLQTNATDRWNIGGSTGTLLAVTDNQYDFGANNASRPRALFLAQPSVTVGSGTGVTLVDSGSVRELVYKVTIDRTAFITAGLTSDITIATLPANSWLVNVTANLSTTFACSVTCTTGALSAVLGKGAGGAEYLASLDADAATSIFGDADAELGTLMVRAAAIQGGTFTTSSQAVVVRLISGTGNIGTGAATNLSQGSITFWLTTRVLQ